MCDDNYPSLVASLFSWRCLPASTSYFLHVAMNLRRPSVTVPTHTSASNAVVFQSPTMPNTRVSVLYAIGPLFLLPAPSSLHCTLKVSEHESLGSRAPLIWMSALAQKLWCATLSQRSHTGLSQAHGCMRPSNGLVSYAVPQWCKAKPSDVRCTIWRKIPGERPMYCIHTGRPRLPRPLPFGS